MRILYIASDTNLFFDQIGGAGTHIRATIKYLEKHHEVIRAIGGDLLNIGGNDNQSRIIVRKKGWKKLIPSCIKLLYQDFRIIKRNRNVLIKTEELIRAHRPDVIYERSCYGYSVGLLLSERYHIPRCMETDVLMFELKKETTSFLFNRLIYRILEQKKFTRADVITVQSEYSVKLCKRCWNISHDRVFNKDLGIDLTKIKMVSDNTILDDLFHVHGKFIVAFVGIFQKYQRVDLLVKAAELLKDNTDIVFLVVGSGYEDEILIEQVQNKGLKNIIFTGKFSPDKIHMVYNRMDIGIIPDCAYHMYPVKFLEYSIYKKVTIIPKYEVFKPFFPTGVDFQKVSFIPRNVSDMVSQIKAVKNDRDLRNRVGSYIYEYVKTNHTWEKCGELVERALIVCQSYKKDNDHT